MKCEPGHEDFFKFTSRLSGKLTKAMVKQSVQSFCFKQVNYWFTQENEHTVSVWIDSIGQKSKCSDSYLLSVGSHFHYVYVNQNGPHQVKFTNINADDQLVINNSGLQILRFCDQVSHLVPDLIMTASMFADLVTNINTPIIHARVPMAI